MATTVINLRNGKVKDAIYIGRPSLFGNPFVLGFDGDREEVLRSYRDYFFGRLASDPAFLKEILALKDKVLACFCVPELCHGQVIAEWLDAPDL